MRFSFVTQTLVAAPLFPALAERRTLMNFVIGTRLGAVTATGF
jgi:hypothetical protein